MPKYKVCVTRIIKEVTDITVNADNPLEAARRTRGWSQIEDFDGPGEIVWDNIETTYCVDPEDVEEII